MRGEPYIKFPPGVAEGGPLKIDWSGFRRVLECERKAWWELAWRRVGKGDQMPLLFGDAFHQAADARQKWVMGGGDPAKALPSMEEALERAYNGVPCRHCNGVGLLPNNPRPCVRCGGRKWEKYPIEVPEDDHRHLGRAKEVAGLYVKEYEGEDFEILESEQAGERVLGEVEWIDSSDRAKRRQFTPVIWQGKTDGLWRRRDSKRTAIKDTKTMKEGDLEREGKKYSLSTQMMMYCWLFGPEEGPPMNEAIIDVVIVRPPLLRPTARSKPRTEFLRVVQDYPREMVEETKRGVLATLGRWLETMSQGMPPVREPACAWCPYFKACEMSKQEDRVETVLSGEFEDNTWDPMGKVEEMVPRVGVEPKAERTFNMDY